MKLFDETKRQTLTYPSSVLSGYVHLNRDNTPGAQQLREQLESWFGEFPEASQRDLKERFRSNNPDTHQSALFEIFLHRLLSALGCNVEVHPKISGTDSRPDFLVHQGERCFYLEATAVGRTSGPFALSNNEQDALDKLRTLTSSDFNLGFETRGTLTRTLRRNHLLPRFQQLLEAYEPDWVQEQIDEGGLAAAPSARYEVGDWCVEAWLIPIGSQSQIPNQSRTISVMPLKAAFTNALEPVRNALKEKGHKYGQPKLPLVVAVHTRDMFYNGRRCDMEVMFGDECILSSSENSELSRIPNGLWSGGRSKRIAAFWRFQKVDVWNLARSCGCLYMNPTLGSTALPGTLFRLPHGKVINDKMEWFGDNNAWQLLCKYNP